ncbi:MAG: hypothetical protein PWR20_321 [Bacteroidales bacterium]|jgi:hypothetical protein|nr:hypothetical protein [Bacteroidales bacterium]MDN5330006.1 hypothetical protein [Bacteroidales bacterium]
MSSHDSKNTVIYYFLRFGVIIYLFGVLWHFARRPGFEIAFWNDFVQIAAAIVYVIMVILVLAAPKHNFNILGFFFTALGSFSLILKDLFIKGAYSNLPAYAFIIIVSFYFMTKGGEHHSRHRNYF